MTGEQKQTVLRRRSAGFAYSQIADEVGLSLNTVKSCCRRAGLSESNASKETGNKENKDFCKQCGEKLIHTQKAKPKKFCGESCRFAYWNTHRNQMNRKAICPVVCVHCGKVFDSYNSAGRKYCSHHCYIARRFAAPCGEAVRA